MKDLALAKINDATDEECATMLHACAGTWALARELASQRPFATWTALEGATNAAWNGRTETEVREAASHHPRIGADRAALRAKFARTATWSTAEQAGVAGASDDVLDALAKANDTYADTFGYTFIVCASGKSAAEMLEIVNSRIPSAPEAEWKVAREELRKITLIRLEKLGSS